MEKHYPGIRLVIVHSEYRSIVRPLARFIDRIRSKAENDHFVITVIVPQFITKKVGRTYCITKQELP